MTAATVAREAEDLVKAQFGREDFVLRRPALTKGLGDVISNPQSDRMIYGVKIGVQSLWPDDRGYFMEIIRSGQGLVRSFSASSTQVSAALSYAGTIKAFHYHLNQHDCWTTASGQLQVALVDLRAASPTFGRRNTIYIGTLRPWQVLIPPGVGHGYKVIGADPALLVYATDQYYNPNDEGRIVYNDPQINYDWETQYK